MINISPVCMYVCMYEYIYVCSILEFSQKKFAKHKQQQQQIELITKPTTLLAKLMGTLAMNLAFTYICTHICTHAYTRVHIKKNARQL